MPETLPGNPTDAGPDIRNEPSMKYDDYMMYAEEELCFARRRHSIKTRTERQQLLDAIARAEVFIEGAKAAIRAR